MFHRTRFWTLMFAFQLVFGFTVFALTRAHYAGREAAPAPPPKPAGQTSSQWSAAPAGSDLENLIAAFPGLPLAQDPAALSRQADRFFTEQRYGEAANLYQQALAAGSQDADDYNSLGLTLHYLGRSAEALQVLDEGITFDPAYQRIWLTLGFVNSQVGHTEQARAALTRAVQMAPDNDIGQSAARMLESLPR
jgi:tetratricopeptide (TPR) repeat protein